MKNWTPEKQDLIDFFKKLFAAAVIFGIICLAEKLTFYYPWH
jgi:hypothetical protein